MSFYSLCGSVTLLGFFLCISEVESMRTLKNVAVKRGGSVTIPCLYNEKNKANYKYWCKGPTCSVIAYANSNGNPSVIDHPEQNLFTVELISVSESGTRWCAVEIGDKWQPDDRDYLYLTVSQDPDLLVRESRVRGEEGGRVTVQCLYSAAYQNTQKQWCRFKDGQCNTVRTKTSQTPAVYISDDGRGSFNVRMSGLKKSDAGWYWCSAGDLQVPVHISVGSEAPGLPRNHTINNPYHFSDTLLTLGIISGLLLVLMVVGLSIWKLKQKRTELLAANKGYSHSLNPKRCEDEVTYSTVTHGQRKASSTSEPEVSYSSVRISQKATVSEVPSNNSVIYSSVKHQQ